MTAQPVEEEETSRVSMNWPNSLKEEVQDLVGKRGLTAFVLEAVNEKLEETRIKVSLPKLPAGRTAAREPERGFDPVMNPQHARQLADESASAPVVAEPPPAMVAAEPVAEPEPATVEEQDHQPMALTKPRSDKTTMFDRIRAEAADLGLDIKPASEILAPEPKPDAPGAAHAERTPTPIPDPIATTPAFPQGPPVPIVEQPVASETEPESAPVTATPAAELNVCQNCGGILIDGDCWECM